MKFETWYEQVKQTEIGSWNIFQTLEQQKNHFHQLVSRTPAILKNNREEAEDHLASMNDLTIDMTTSLKEIYEKYEHFIYQ